MSLSKQEMFDRAYRGLASQRWAKSTNAMDGCVYAGRAGRRCAWGWVDTSLERRHYGNVRDLHDEGIGVAADMGHDEIVFALELQSCHDQADDNMRIDLERFAKLHNLTIPELT